MINCPECGHRFDPFGDDDDDEPRRDDLVAQQLVRDLLDEPAHHFVAELYELHAGHPAIDDEFADLIAAAASAARRGDIEYARHVLRLAAYPKWSSEAACLKQYNEAMGRAVA